MWLLPLFLTYLAHLIDLVRNLTSVSFLRSFYVVLELCKNPGAYAIQEFKKLWKSIFSSCFQSTTVATEMHNVHASAYYLLVAPSKPIAHGIHLFFPHTLSLEISA